MGSAVFQQTLEMSMCVLKAGNRSDMRENIWLGTAPVRSILK